MNLPSIELASLTGPHDLCGVGHSSRPVEALPKGVSHQRSRRDMVATSPRVYVLKELDSFLTGDAAHKNARWAALVHLSIEE